MTAWISFGQTLARSAGFYVVPKKLTVVDGCPSEWLNSSSLNAAEKENFMEISGSSEVKEIE